MLKCLSGADWVACFGTDINADAYGHSDSRFQGTRVLRHATTDQWVADLLAYAHSVGATVIAPGAEAAHRILTDNIGRITEAGFTVMVNSSAVIELCSDKVACNEFLAGAGFKTPRTMIVNPDDRIADFDAFPCVVKPARDSGGSNMVFLAENAREARFFVDYISTRGYRACIQEYIDSAREYTVGVLSTRERQVLSTVALQRDLTQKLSRSLAYGDRVISSGWSQGRIDHFPEVCEQAEAIAKALGSTWALNIQGRVLDGQLIPFEVNPRHSGTSYLRALAGVNEPLIALSHLLGVQADSVAALRPGRYHRVFTEHVVRDDRS